MKNYMKLIFGLGLIALVGYWPAAKTPKRVNSLFLQNVEALAGSEHVTNLGCLGDGSVDCPINHIKVEHVVQGFSLGSEDSFTFLRRRWLPEISLLPYVF